MPWIITLPTLIPNGHTSVTFRDGENDQFRLTVGQTESHHRLLCRFGSQACDLRSKAACCYGMLWVKTLVPYYPYIVGSWMFMMWKLSHGNDTFWPIPTYIYDISPTKVWPTNLGMSQTNITNISLKDMNFIQKFSRVNHHQILAMQLIRYFAWEHAHEHTHTWGFYHQSNGDLTIGFWPSNMRIPDHQKWGSDPHDDNR